MANAILNIGATGGQVNISTAAAPATPAAGVVTLYAGTDKALHALNEDGLDVTIATGASSPITLEQTNSLVSTAIGATATQPNSVVIGATACSASIDNIIIGVCAKATVSYACGNVVIGSLACTTAAGNANSGAVVVGYKACEIGATDGPGNVTIGCNARSTNSAGNVVIGVNAFVSGTSNYLASRAQVAIGNGSCSNAIAANAIGTQAVATGLRSLAVGAQPAAIGASSIAAGFCSCSTQSNSIAIGCQSFSCHSAAIALGAGITTVRTNTTHVNSLVAFGQAASLAHSVGSTGGTATLDWDNSNVQFVTLDSSITSLTKSNPIDGGVYTLFVTQGGSGSYTVDWGADVKWAGGTGPTLSTAIGATDAVSLVYYAGVTGYYGNANLNFA